MINWRGGCFLDLKALLNKEQYEGAVTVEGPVLIIIDIFIILTIL